MKNTQVVLFTIIVGSELLAFNVLLRVSYIHYFSIMKIFTMLNAS